MSDAKTKLDLGLGFRLIDEQDALAQTHWLIFDPPEGYELDDHPPKGPDDRLYVRILTQKERDFLSDSRVDGCKHRVIRHEEWPQESRVVITQLWWALSMWVERSAERKAKRKKMKRKLQVVLFCCLVAPAPVLMLLEGSSLITLDQFDHAFHLFYYIAAGIIGALYVVSQTEVCSEDG